MSSIVAVLVALLAHAGAQAAEGEGWTAPLGGVAGLLFCGALVLLPYGASIAAVRSAHRGRFARARRWIVATENAGWVAFAAALFLGGWLGAVRRWTGAALDLEAWPDGALLLSLLPFVVYQLAAVDAASRAHGGTPATQRGLRSFQARLFLSCLVPIALFIGAAALAGQSPWLRAHIEHVDLVGALFAAGFIALMMLVLPWILVVVWSTAPFPPGPQREVMDVIAARAAFVPRVLRIWRTGGLVANATIVGAGRGRAVLFTDQLVAMLNTRELASVYAHEIGHARRGHVGMFLALTFGVFALGDRAMAAIEEAHGEWQGLAFAAGLTVLWWVGFGWLSRRAEHDADLFGYQVTGDLPAFVSALERVGGGARDRGSWRHPSVRRRRDFLALAAADPGMIIRFRRRLDGIRLAGFALALIGGLVQLAAMVGDLRVDRTVASLATGSYGRAAELASGIDAEENAVVIELVEAASRVTGPSTDDARRALALAVGPDTPAAEALAMARLASIRGVRGAGRVALALERLEAGDAEGASAAARGLPEDLRDGLLARGADQE